MEPLKIKCPCSAGYTQRLACEALGWTYYELRQVYWGYKALVLKTHDVEETSELPSEAVTLLHDVWAMMYLPVQQKMNEIGNQHNPECICKGTGIIRDSNQE